MEETILKILIFLVGVLIGELMIAILAAAERNIVKDQIDPMRIRIKKQDDAIRQKQNRIDQLEKKIKYIERRR